MAYLFVGPTQVVGSNAVPGHRSAQSFSLFRRASVQGSVLHFAREETGHDSRLEHARQNDNTCVSIYHYLLLHKIRETDFENVLWLHDEDAKCESIQGLWNQVVQRSFIAITTYEKKKNFRYNLQYH
jgi:hypothetical protein